ncbi:biotin--[acetyl-CoA-carboxylase] ligase [Psychroserpens ponticola]|uniref:Biotin--[acetyl-CoA-carboxylase] ligase n=1 Tax=Psychroserpens ponticola TaxID=2932268 RepID=A0ABY7RZQ6_9FLAO|nr:biotin--[acetyl-CoA-carboxylase] ligase [Psychroserpens ponticola]WCO02389.1 biotin--[acetyl-CoA-carboxylase] ligase [Psychroserpens ponticola]
MRTIKLNAIDSTNSFLRQLSAEETVEDFTVVTAEHQTGGRGQMGTKWESQSAKNLMFSVFKDTRVLDVECHFYLSMAVSLAVFEALKSFQITSLKIKWPNDILSDQQKVCGILIENVIKQNQLQSSIIGIGINVNQTIFNDLPNATSMQLISGTHFNRDQVLQEVLNQLKHYISFLDSKSYDLLKQAYENNLFRKDKPSTFKDKQGNLFSGYIKGVSNSGHLKVLIEDGIVKLYELKEVQLLF